MPGCPAVEADALIDAAERFRPALSRYFLRHAPQGEVEDLVQDALLRLHIRSNVHEIDNIEGYLFQVAASIVADRGRRARVRHAGAHVELTDTLHPVEMLTPDRVLAGRETVDRLVTALDEMPDLTRNVFILHRFEELAYGEIADRLDLSVSQVGRQIMKALKMLAERDLP